MFSSKSMEWATPQNFFDKLNDEFHFTLDPCADEFNHKCGKYFTEKDNGLEQCWGGAYRFLQSSIWQNGERLGKEMFRGSKEAWNNNCTIDSSQNRHQLFSRLHIPKTKCGNPVYSWAFEIWRWKEFCTISKYGSHF